MRVDVMKHYGLTMPLSQAGYYETTYNQQLMSDIRSAILDGRLVALSGVIGIGKTVMLERIRQVLEEEKHVIVSQSFAIDKRSIKLSTLLRRCSTTCLAINKCVYRPTSRPVTGNCTN